MLNGCEWVANISVFALFQWLKKPIDIDGDGIFSITDLYKYVSFYTNDVTRSIEKIQTYHLIDASVKLKMEEARATPSSSFSSLITKDAAEAIRNYIVPHQNTWMLNAIAAGSMHLE